MKTSKSVGIFPCATFFAEGRPVSGSVALLLQMTLIFWPLAARWARETTERTGIEKLLTELSDAYHGPDDNYRYASKKFREAAEPAHVA
jgi:hypothetical protein